MQMLSKGAVHPAIEVKIATFAAVRGIKYGA